MENDAIDAYFSASQYNGEQNKHSHGFHHFDSFFGIVSNFDAHYRPMIDAQLMN